MSESRRGGERDHEFEAVLVTAGQRLADAFVAKYSVRYPAVASIVTKLVAAQKKKNFFKQRARMTVDEQLIATYAFFGIHLMRGLVPEVPELTELAAETYRRARAKPVSAGEWSRLFPERYSDNDIPDLLDSRAWVDPRIWLAPETIDFFADAHSRSDAPPRLESVFSLWRSAEVYGFTTASRGQGIDSLIRFVPQVIETAKIARDAISIRADDFEQAYFANLDREVQRAQYPFGLEMPEHRDAMILAIALSIESESGGILRPTAGAAEYLDLDPEARAMRLTPADLYTVFRSTVARISRSESEHVRPALPFDLIRAAAAVQSQAAQRHELPPVAPTGWVPILQENGFGVRVESVNTSDAPSPKSSAQRLPFAREVLRLLPYSPDAANAINRMFPVGSPRAIAQQSENFELRDFQGRAREDVIVSAIRVETLDAYYRERFGNDQLAQAREPELGKVNAALKDLMSKRLFDIFDKANKRVREVDFELAEQQENPGASLARIALDHDAMLSEYRDAKLGIHIAPTRAHMARTAAAAPEDSTSAIDEVPAEPGDAREEHTPRFGTTRQPWVEEFIAIIPAYVASYRAYQAWQVAQGAAPSLLDIRAIRDVESFTVWLKRQVAQHDAPVAAAAARYWDDIRSGRTQSGRVLPEHLQRVALWDDLDVRLGTALTNWASELTGNESVRTRARGSVETVLRRIYSSPVWFALASGVSLEKIDEYSDVNIVTTMDALDSDSPLRELLPPFLADFLEEIDQEREDEEPQDG